MSVLPVPVVTFPAVKVIVVDRHVVVDGQSGGVVQREIMKAGAVAPAGGPGRGTVEGGRAGYP